MCHHIFNRLLSRRDVLMRHARGLGAATLGGVLSRQTLGARTSPLAPKQPHFNGKAKNIVFLYMDGGPSQVDTFDYKPSLAKYDGKDPRKVIGKLEPTQFNNVGRVMKSPWKFKQHGKSGLWMSDLFPHIAKNVADELCVIKSMVAKFPEHTSGNYFLHTGNGLQGRPSMGAWFGYALGSENQDLPGFVVLNGGLIPPGGLDNFNSGYLPAAFQGSIFNPGPAPVANIKRYGSAQRQREQLALLKNLDEESLKQIGHHDQLESAIANYQTAVRMQTSVPELMDLSKETANTKNMYGLDAKFKNTQLFGRSCLLARRLVERGVRFIELTCPNGNGDRWDQHRNLIDGHNKNALSVDQPIAALIKDLRDRGLLESTLVVWAGEFGRTPFAQGQNGRDHNPHGFSVWLAGGGVKGGISYGATDVFGYKAIQDKVEMHDLHATMMHLMGLDHTKVTFRFSSRDMRLTDVHGQVVEDILA